MARFEPDFSIFGILAGDILPEVAIEQTRIDYTNKACIDNYGDLLGRTIADVFYEIVDSKEDCTALLSQFKDAGRITFEGKLNGKFIKFHSRIIDCREDDACAITQFIQGGITDITESVVLKKLLFGTSEALRRAAEAADDDTGRHISRINEYSKKLAELYTADDIFIENIASFAQLHDIGKIKIAEIIRVPRELTEKEFCEVKKHPEYGGKMVEGLAGLEMAYDIIIEHHEKWDGSGYPFGKKKEEISLAGRIVALVDAFDALVSERPYKRAYSYDETLEILTKGDDRVRPEHYDPKLLQLFLENYQEFVGIHRSMK